MDMIAWYVVFLFSLTFHEASHSFFAYKLGDPTAYYSGQVTLDPLPHIRREPFGMVLVPLLSYLFYGYMIGWASAPYDPLWALRNPKKSAIMSLAGPLSNFVLAFFSALAIKIGLFLGLFTAPYSFGFFRIIAPTSPGILYPVSFLLSIMFTLNLILFVFNLIPLPPLDGFGAIPLILSEDAGRKYHSFFMSNPLFYFLGLIIAWNIFGFIFTPIFLLALKLIYL